MKLKAFSSFVLVLFLLLASTTVLLAAPALTGAQYVIEGSETMTVAWEPVPDAGAYEVRLLMLHLTPATYFALARVPAIENTVTIAQPKAGLFQVEVRTCRYADCDCGIDADGDGQLDDCSIWAVSTDPAFGTVDGSAMGWWIYWKLPGVGGPVIE